jgi:Ca2+-binding EF-hand superfamily protein
MNTKLRSDRIAFTLFVSALLLALLAALPFAVVRASSPVAATPVFDLVDRNRDGYVDRKEAEAVPGLSADFDKMDINRDGRLDRVEFARW